MVTSQDEAVGFKAEEFESSVRQKRPVTSGGEPPVLPHPIRIYNSEPDSDPDPTVSLYK